MVPYRAAALPVKSGSKLESFRVSLPGRFWSCDAQGDAQGDAQRVMMT